MIVIRDIEHFKIYYPKLSIKACLTLDNLFGEVTAPIINGIPSLENQCLILSLCLQDEHLGEDEIYDILDLVDDPIKLIIELYEEAGLISQDAEENPVEGDSEPTNDGFDESLTFAEYMDKLLEQCMSIGMSEDEFMNSTLKQITRYAESYQTRKRSELEQQAMMDYSLSVLIRIGIASCLAKGVDFPSIQDAYPFLKETAINTKENNNNEIGIDGMTAEEREIEYNRLKMMEWAEAMNKKRKKKQEKSEDKVE